MEFRYQAAVGDELDDLVRTCHPRLWLRVTSGPTENATATTEVLTTPGLVLVWTPAGPTCQALPVDPNLLIGRDGISGFDFGDSRISRRHCEVEHVGPSWVIHDLGSRNGTHVDGSELASAPWNGDFRVLRVGRCIFIPTARVEDYGLQATEDQLRGYNPRRRIAAEMVLQLAKTSGTLSVIGEPGCGKAAAARLFHEAGPRSGGPFVEVHCRGLDDDIVSRILFGTNDTSLVGNGALRAAEGGTLLLNGVESIALRLQHRLLRTLEAAVSLALQPRGDAHQINLGIVTASRTDLRLMLDSGDLLEGLFFRLGRSLVSLPPLRECPEDLAPQIVEALENIAPSTPAHVSLIESCLLRHWPGNLLELRTEIQMAAHRALVGGHDRVRASDLAQQAGIRFDKGEQDRGGTHHGLLRLLVLVANPMTTARLDIASEFRELDEALGGAHDDGRVDLRLVLIAEPEDIQQHVLRFCPTVVHFSAHGDTPDDDGDQGGIIIDGPDGAYELSAAALASFFSHFNGTVRCVVFNACHSQRQAELLASSVDCVIGMRRAISDHAASVFSGAFYEAVAHGESIHVAFGLGCAAIELHGLDEGDVPSLALRSGVDAREIRLLPVASSPASGEHS